MSENRNKFASIVSQRYPNNFAVFTVKTFSAENNITFITNYKKA